MKKIKNPIPKINKAMVRYLVETIDDLISEAVLYNRDPLTKPARKIVEKARIISEKE